jgi:predicted ATP-dependent endonuclease of OLD family
MFQKSLGPKDGEKAKKMHNKLERVTIIGLHGNKTIDAQFTDGTLILVGENGSGKTTFLRILFYVLAGRWLPLASFNFERIIIAIAGKEFQIVKKDLLGAAKAFDRRALRTLPLSVRRRFEELMERGASDEIGFEMERLTRHVDVYTAETIARQFDLFEGKLSGPNKELQELRTKIREAVDAQILYLPTYRRIERELGSIFEGGFKGEVQQGV